MNRSSSHKSALRKVVGVFNALSRSLQIMSSAASAASCRAPTSSTPTHARIDTRAATCSSAQPAPLPRSAKTASAPGRSSASSSSTPGSSSSPLVEARTYKDPSCSTPRPSSFLSTSSACLIALRMISSRASSVASSADAPSTPTLAAYSCRRAITLAAVATGALGTSAAAESAADAMCASLGGGAAPDMSRRREACAAHRDRASCRASRSTCSRSSKHAPSRSLFFSASSRSRVALSASEKSEADPVPGRKRARCAGGSLQGANGSSSSPNSRDKMHTASQSSLCSVCACSSCSFVS
mmetsp:Transcript_32275/g.67909  ORF Transcript_32275/g.67909 Transcript_32275/m.67909 type:complete len:298 (-) Transcript_32275:183-1076(-)